jgi:signal transduction histidine kinase
VLAPDGELLGASEELKRLLVGLPADWPKRLGVLSSLEGVRGGRGELWLAGRSLRIEVERVGDVVLAIVSEPAPARDAFARLAEGMVHDARSPLNAMALQLEVVSDRLRTADRGLADSLEKSLDSMRAQIGRVDALLKRFLQFASPRPEPPKLVDLADALNRAVEACAHDARRHGVRIETRLERVAISAEASSLAPALLRLVMEGIDASRSGGALRIAVAPREHDAVVSVSDDAGSEAPSWTAARELAHLLRGTLEQRRFGEGQQIELRVPRGSS